MTHLRSAAALVLALSVCLTTRGVWAQSCTPQSQMKAAERDALTGAANSFAEEIAGSKTSELKSGMIAELQADFAPVANLVTATAPHLVGGSPQVEQLYLLDASSMQKTNGANPDAQFFCTLNQSPAEADFNIPQLPPGRYAFAMVGFNTAIPYRLSMLLRQDAGVWHIAGLYPKALAANGHEGLWFWQQARTLASSKEPWNAWLYLQEAQALLTPASFVSSSHLDKLAAEVTAAAPPAVGAGLTADAPLVVRAAGTGTVARPAGAEFRFTALSVTDALGPDKLDVTAHIKVEALGDAAAARQRNLDAMAALVDAHPELRKAFHGVWVFADAPNSTPFGTELAMAEIK